MAAAGVPELLAASSTDVVVLERLARSAGTTNWFVLRRTDGLDGLAARLSPGSSLSFYFDGRIASREYDTTVAELILSIVRADRDAVVGRLDPDGTTLKVDYVASQSELEEFTLALAAGSNVYFGSVPARDNDGKRAITIDLPDLDGIVRRHPH
jgi:hypothetical protein